MVQALEDSLKMQDVMHLLCILETFGPEIAETYTACKAF